MRVGLKWMHWVTCPALESRCSRSGFGASVRHRTWQCPSVNARCLLVELLERARQIGVGPHQLDDGEPALPSFVDADPPRSSPVVDDDEAPIGRVIPAAMAFLGVAFTACALVTARLPPLSGSVAKRALLSALLELRTPAA